MPELIVEGGMELSVSPGRVFFAPDVKSPEGTESCFFIVRRKGSKGADLSRGQMELFSKGKQVKTIGYSAESMAATMLVVESLDSIFYMFYVREPASLAIDSIMVTLESKAEKGTVEVRPQHYSQVSKLIFPFEGPGLVSQGGFNNGGHANASSQFAIDVLGLTPNYAPQTEDLDRNESYAGWGRTILAPGDGVVVSVQDGIPDQIKPGTMDANLFVTKAGKQVSQGNNLIIEHQGGEFSQIMHMQNGSLRIKAGDQVKRGQELGKLGNSGNSYGPHLHIQLMDSANFATASGLPISFENVTQQPLVRGVYFKPTGRP